jgi:polyisoprenoid-binding protein YceI
MKQITVRAALALALLAPAAADPVAAQALNFSIDRAHTQVMFRVRHLGVAWVTGRFTQYEGSFVLDTVNVANSSATLTIQTASVNTNNERRDADLRSNNFFAADSFPEITFRSTRAERGSAPGTYRLTGDLTMRGTTRPITLEVETTGMRESAGQRGRQLLAGFVLTGRLNRHDYGLRWNNLVEGVSVVGEEVRLTIEVEARAPIS